MMIEKEQLTGFVLAGGKSLRFGKNKALARYKGKTLLQSALERLTPYCGTVCISGDFPEYKDYEEKGYPLIPDVEEDKGPVGGIYAALSSCGTPYALFLPCDMPLITERLVVRILSETAGEGITAWMRMDGRLQFFPLLCCSSLLPQIRLQVEAGRLSMRNLLLLTTFRLLSLSGKEESAFFNVNSINDYCWLTGQVDKTKVR